MPSRMASPNVVCPARVLRRLRRYRLPRPSTLTATLLNAGRSYDVRENRLPITKVEDANCADERGGGQCPAHAVQVCSGAEQYRAERGDGASHRVQLVESPGARRDHG